MFKLQLNKANKKSIILLLTINFLTILILSGVTSDGVKALNTPLSIADEVEIVNSNELLNFELENVEVTVTEDNQTLSVNQFQAKKIEQMREEYIKRLEEEERERQRKTLETSRSVDYSSIDVTTNLSAMNTVTADDLNNVISYWDQQNGVTAFSGKGQYFIDAAKQSGLDPVYILAHAGLESAWGKSKIAMDKNNFFGIAAYDNSPYTSSYEMGNGLYDGIVSGAIWIARNYYANGQTSLYSMRYNNEDHEYCTSNSWMHDIVNIMQRSYELIQR